MTRPTSIFQFTLPRLDGGTIDLAAYAGRPMLIANTASKCGFTGQYAGLQRLWDTYRDRGLVVLGVPSNDFGRQEPAESAEIAAFCETNYGVTFPLAGKLHVRGAAADALFRFIGEQAGALARPRWNFYKYIISPTGRVASWFTSMTSPDSARVSREIENQLLS